MAKVTVRLNPAMTPIPTLLVTCIDAAGKANIITISYAGIINTLPPIVNIAIKPSRYSHGVIRETREFAINIPGVDLLEISDWCGVVSGREVDKFAESGLTALPATRIRSPLIEECPVNFECQVIDIQTYGGYDLFVAEIVACHADEEMLGDGKKVDIGRLQPIAFCYNAMEYWSLAEPLGRYGYTKGKLSQAR